MLRDSTQKPSRARPAEKSGSVMPAKHLDSASLAKKPAIVAPIKKPDIVAPGGNFEKMMLAYEHGADAVYVGGPVFGLRKYSDNFSMVELKDAISIARSFGKKLYVVLNGFARSDDLEKLTSHLKALEELRPHAFIVSDLGVLSMVNAVTSIPAHLSTQASVTQHRTVEFWKRYGVKRVVLAREVNLEDARFIRQSTGLETEVFVHGAMCASYSGKCVISNYTSGRDSNRGGCIQTCRHKFSMFEPGASTRDSKPLVSAHVMNAKDLNGSELIASFIRSSVDAVKIEGRMKSNFYVSSVVGAYRRIIDETFASIQKEEAESAIQEVHSAKQEVQSAIQEAQSVIQETQSAILPDSHRALHFPSNRGFETGGLVTRPGGSSLSYAFNGYNKQYQYIGLVKKIVNKQDSQTMAWAHMTSDLSQGDTCTVFRNGQTRSVIVRGIQSITGVSVAKTKPDSFVCLDLPCSLQVGDILLK